MSQLRRAYARGARGPIGHHIQLRFLAADPDV
jgi:hypothetical protein